MKTFIDEIKENDGVDSIFLVKDKTTAITRTGSPYLKLRLLDRSGEIEGRIWSAVESCGESFQKDEFVRIRGKAVSYLDRLQLNINQIERVDEKEIQIEDFFPTTRKNVDEMFEALRAISDRVSQPHLRRLLSLFWEDEAFVERFKKAPASKQIHHACLGGLLEHTLSVAELVLKVAPHYEGLNLDLLITGTILHDLGKIEELSYSRSFDYTDRGKLLGHIVLGVERVEEKIRQVSGFPEDLGTLLKHLLLSHHGQYLYGSPKKPMILEAVMLHYLDDMDAKISGIQTFLGGPENHLSGWSAYHPIFEQSYYRYVPRTSEDGAEEEDAGPENG